MPLAAVMGQICSQTWKEVEKTLTVETDSYGSRKESYFCVRRFFPCCYSRIVSVSEIPEYGFPPPSGFIGLSVFVGEGPHSFPVANAELECHLVVALRSRLPAAGAASFGTGGFG